MFTYDNMYTTLSQEVLSQEGKRVNQKITLLFTSGNCCKSIYLGKQFAPLGKQLSCQENRMITGAKTHMSCKILLIKTLTVLCPSVLNYSVIFYAEYQSSSCLEL